MSKMHIGVGDDFPVNDATETQTHPCRRAHATWAARREARRACRAARHAARRERWRQWWDYWNGRKDQPQAPAQQTDASYTDVPPVDKKDV